MKRFLLSLVFIAPVVVAMNPQDKKNWESQMNSGPVRNVGRPSGYPTPVGPPQNPNQVPRINEGCNIQ